MKRLIFFFAMVYGPVAYAQNGLYNNGAVIHIGTGAGVHANGHLTNIATGNFSNNGIVTISGNIINYQLMNDYTGKLVLKGTTRQSVSGSEFLTGDLEIDNLAGVDVNTPLKVSGVCNFVSGIIATANESSPLWFTTTGTFTNAINTSHVSGTVVKEGIGNFIYPVGNGTFFQPVQVNLTTNASGLSVNYSASDAGSGGFTGSQPLHYYNALEHWMIRPLSDASGTVTIFWDSHNNTGISNTSHLRVAQLESGSWINEGASSVSGTVAAGNITSDLITNWSAFTLGSMSHLSTLPLKWLSVRALLNSENKAVLTWKVDELRVKNYEVEKSINNTNFKAVGNIAGKGDGGHTYTFIEQANFSQLSYYRIKQIDTDGRYSYSPTVSLKPAAAAGVIVYPIPFRTSFTVRSETAQTLRLTTIDGRILRTLKVQAGLNQVNASDLGKGTYLLIGEANHTQKIVKE